MNCCGTGFSKFDEQHGREIWHFGKAKSNAKRGFIFCMSSA